MGDAVEALILDLFGVIISFDDDIVCQRIARHCSNPESAFMAMRGLVSREDLIRGQLTLEQLHSEIVNEHSLKLDFCDFESVWLTPYTKNMPGMAQLIRALAHNYRLVLLSNVDKYYWEVIQETHFELTFFHTQLLSWEQGIAKPDRDFFLRAVEATGTSASRCFFIDDKIENVETARALGLRGHQFLTTNDLYKVFKKEGIRCNQQ